MLPHIKNSKAGANKYEYVAINIFEVFFTLPEPLRKDFAKDETILTEHVTKVSGLDALNKAPETVVQKFMGTDRSFIANKLDSTRAEFSIEFTLNLRNSTDNYILKLFKSWANLGYNMATGEKHLKVDYCADWMKISVAGRNGDIWRDILFKDVMMGGSIEGLSDLDYDSADPQTITVKFVSDWWDDLLA